MSTKGNEPEIQAVLANIPAMTDCRLLVSFDSEGKMHTTPVPPDACVMSRKQMLEAINKGMVLDTDMLAEFALATIKNLQSRCNYVNSLRTINEV